VILNDKQIDQLAREGMIEPYTDHLVREEDGHKIISYGLSSFGYDIRISNEFYIFSNVCGSAVVDPKNFPEEAMVKRVVQPHDAIIVPPNTYVLGRSVEYVRMPDDVMTVCIGKSTYARCGIIVNVTPLEAGWEGHVTIEISNSTPLSAKVYAYEGILQVLFFRGERPAVTYADRKGKYQETRGVVFSRV
jgi:dCTP deaminase